MIKDWVDMYNQMASNWILRSVDQILFDCSEVRLTQGGAGKVDLPSKIRDSRCIINFEMEGEKCFLTAILIALHHNEFANPYRTAQYQKYVQDFDTSKIQFPVCAAQIQVFEKCNPNISVFAHEWDDKKGPQFICKTSH